MHARSRIPCLLLVLAHRVEMPQGRGRLAARAEQKVKVDAEGCVPRPERRR
jgi:hypothetical protein